MRRFSVITWVIVRNALRGLQSSPLPSAIAVVTIAIALVLVGSFALVIGNMEGLLSRFSEELHVVAYLDEDLPGSDQRALAESAGLIEGVASVSLVTPAQALERFRMSMGGGDLLEGLERITSISLDRLRGLLDLDDLSDSKSLIKTIEKFDFLDSSDNRNISDLRKFYDDINLKDVSDIQELIEAVKSDNENNTVLDLMMGLNNYYEADKDFEMVMTNISLIAHSDLFNIRDRLQVCDDASESGTGADDAVSDDSTESASVCSVPAVEQFREDLALFRVAQSGRNDQELTLEQRQGHRDDYASAYDVKTKSAAAAIQVANARGYSFDVDSPDQLDESFLRNWDSRFCD